MIIRNNVFVVRRGSSFYNHRSVVEYRPVKSYKAESRNNSSTCGWLQNESSASLLLFLYYLKIIFIIINQIVLYPLNVICQGSISHSKIMFSFKPSMFNFITFFNRSLVLSNRKMKYFLVIWQFIDDFCELGISKERASAHK